MKIRSLTLGLAAALLSLPALADQVSGKWNLSIDTPQGPFTMVFDLKADGGKLTGSMSNDFMGVTQISDGTVMGNDLAFRLTLDGGPGGPMTINYKGTVKGDDLTLVSKFEGTPPPGAEGEQTAVAKRAKAG
jgi:hypothetical protein